MTNSEASPARAGLVLISLILVAAVANLNLAVANVALPSIGAVNPALTAMANALRVGDHLLERIGATAAA